MNKNRIIKALLFCTAFLTTVASCVDPFKIDYNLDKGIIIVEGVLTDELSDQYIQLKESKIISSNKVSAIFPLKNCTVEIFVNGVEKVSFIENPKDSGNYLGPKGFKAEPNKTYQLVF